MRMETIMAKARRTTHRSSAGKKLYAVRSADGQFKDIQTFERAHRDDIAHTSAAEVATKVKAAKKAAAAKTSAKKTAKKAVKKTAKKTAKKAAKKTAKKTAKKR
jgi:hypothetical protein